MNNEFIHAFIHSFIHFLSFSTSQLYSSSLADVDCYKLYDKKKRTTRIWIVLQSKQVLVCILITRLHGETIFLCR